MKGNVLRIEKTSIHDGEGLRTVVFFTGCPLQCKWCSTPESQCRYSEFGAGTEMCTEEVVKEVCKDSVFFFHSGGGVTLSGGEVLMQTEFAEEILAGCREEGVSTAIETSLFANFDRIQRLLPYVDTVYADFKVFDDTLHRTFTGVSNERIKENFQRLDAVFGGAIHVRIPAVPGVNMDAENAAATAQFFRPMKRVQDIELLPYHRLGLETYRKWGIDYELPEVNTPDREQLQEMVHVIRKTDPNRRVKIKGEVIA